jgi:glycosyltransferase involved in cell wall biosynthesis
MHIVHIISSLRIGGAERLLVDLLRAWGTVDHHTVLYLHDGPLRNHIENLGIATYNITQFNLWKLLNRLMPHIVHTSLWAANLLGRTASRLLNIPCICSIHTQPRHEGLIRNSIDRLYPITAHHYITVSPSIREAFINKFKMSPHIITTILNGIDTEHIFQQQKEQSLTRSKLGLSEQHYVIGAVGRLVPVKNYHMLITSCAQLIPHYPFIRLLIVGEGPEYTRLSRLTVTLGIDRYVIFVGAQPAYGYYPLCNLFVQPSSLEGLSLALLEALCFQLPVIVTGNLHKHDIITDKFHGLVIEPDNQETLTQALIKYISNRSQHGLFMQNLELIHNNYTLSATVQAYKNLFMTLQRQ